MKIKNTDNVCKNCLWYRDSGYCIKHKQEVTKDYSCFYCCNMYKLEGRLRNLNES